MDGNYAYGRPNAAVHAPISSSETGSYAELFIWVGAQIKAGGVSSRGRGWGCTQRAIKSKHVTAT